MSKRKTEIGDDTTSPATKKIKGHLLIDTNSKVKEYDLPDYTPYEKLAEKYPELQMHLVPRQGPNATSGKHTMDFRNAEAVRTLNRALLCVYFDLDVVLPSDALCPAVANRLNYIKWLGRNIMEEFWPGNTVRGLDIGTGASCIYPLLGTRYIRGSEFVGTDINQASVAVAQQNVRTNALDDRIRVYLNDDRNTVLPIDSVGFPMPTPDADGSAFTFCMCNPPFYDSPEERQQLRQMKPIGRPTLDTGGKDDELYTVGGEEAFLERLVEESAVHKQRIKWYTTMVGKKGTLKALKAKIRDAGAKHVSEGALIQGRTTRWVLAWSFLDKTRFCLDVKKSAADVCSWLESAMDDLQISYNVINDEDVGAADAVARYSCSAVEKTWTRQWRRQQQKQQHIVNADVSAIVPTECKQPLDDKDGAEELPVLAFKASIVCKGLDSCQIHMYLDSGYGSNVLMSLYNHLSRKSASV
ncbi:hypothetical protein IW140_004867 [Coemansia sp. RSA 1813]|nr:hypothetical protein LPJ74_003419 [Coemansia sp. RSA 1843]KAJ2217026.1 hypothetical protein EV179_000793 [Coemansia sp. RSA 487]KAJ2566541.1 hypothetical protein IW140_004867 [Coemansia sp. RSA 1813]